MCYEAAIALTGGDETTLAKSLIISLEDATANWYSRLPPRCFYSRHQLKEEFLLNFQWFQLELDTEEDFLSCAQREKQHCLTFIDGSSSSKLKPQKCLAVKLSHRP
jgi:hypothetical protein